MTAAKLFETGDRVISVHDDTIQAEWRGKTGVVVGPSKVLRGAYYVNFDHTESDRMEDNGGSWLPEMLKSPPAADRTWVPAVGEMCEGETMRITGFPSTLVVGAFVIREPFCNTGRESYRLRTDTCDRHVEIESLRPASRPSLPEAAPVFKVGDAVEWNACGLQTGVVTAVDTSGGLAIRSSRGNTYTMVKPTSVRHAKQATHPPAPERPKAHGIETNCDRCGERVPAATVNAGLCPACMMAWAPKPGDVVEVAEDWDAGEVCRGYVGRLATVRRYGNKPSDGHMCRFEGKESEWLLLIRPYRGALTPKEPSHPAEANVDPYEPCRLSPVQREGVLSATAGWDVTRREDRIAALTASPDPLDRLAAKRSAHVEAHRLGFDVPARVRRDKRTGKVVEWIDSRKPPWECDE